MELGRPLGHLERGTAVRGWRAWVVIETGGGLRLGSPLFDQLWLPGEPAQASCKRADGLFAVAIGPHDVADAACSCGFHAARDAADALSYLRGRDESSTVCRILGEVTLWGDVLETEGGWRATLAYPARLYLPDAALAAELTVYGVSVSSAECASHSSRTCTATPLPFAPRSPTSRSTSST